MKRKVTTYLFWHKTLTGKVKGQKQKHTSGIRQVTDQFLMSHKLSHFNTNLQRWSNSLVYIVIIQTILTLATFLTSVKTNDFHLTGWNKYNFSIGEKKKKKSIFFSKAAPRSQTQLPDSCEEASSPIWILWNCTDVKVFSATAPDNPRAGICNTRHCKPPDGRSCTSHFPLTLPTLLV